MLAKRREIIKNLPKYHKDCFAFSHMRAMLAIDHVYISAKHCNNYEFNYADTDRVVCDIEKYKDKTQILSVCYLLALLQKVANKINNKRREQKQKQEQKNKKTIISRDNLKLKLSFVNDNSYRNFGELEMRFLFKDPRNFISNFMKLLGVNIDMDIFLSMDRMGRNNHFGIDSRYIHWDLPKIIAHITNTPVSKQSKEITQEYSILSKMGKMKDLSSNSEWQKIIGENDTKHGNIKKSRIGIFAYKYWELFAEKYSDIIGQITEKNCEQIYGELKVSHKFICHILMFNKFIFEDIPYCDLYHVELGKYYTINEIKSLKYETVPFNTNASIYDLFEDFSKFKKSEKDHYTQKKNLRKFIIQSLPLFKPYSKRQQRKIKL